MFQTKLVEKIITHILYSIIFFQKSRLYEIKWKNTVEPERLRTKIRFMCISCWILKATNTHSEYVIIIAFTLQQWLHK